MRIALNLQHLVKLGINLGMARSRDLKDCLLSAANDSHSGVSPPPFSLTYHLNSALFRRHVHGVFAAMFEVGGFVAGDQFDDARPQP